MAAVIGWDTHAESCDRRHGTRCRQIVGRVSGGPARVHQRSNIDELSYDMLSTLQDTEGVHRLQHDTGPELPGTARRQW